MRLDLPNSQRPWDCPGFCWQQNSADVHCLAIADSSMLQVMGLGDGTGTYASPVGGSHDYPNSCFGILGDYVVYFRDTPTATAGAAAAQSYGRP
jgi:hypothetical protein